jgi:hypothetical protein
LLPNPSYRPYRPRSQQETQAGAGGAGRRPLEGKFISPPYRARLLDLDPLRQP